MQCIYVVTHGPIIQASTPFCVCTFNTLQFNQFFATNTPSGDVQRNQVAQMSLLLQQNIDWIVANAADVQRWLADNVSMLSSFPDSVQPLAEAVPESPFAFLYYNLPDDEFKEL